MRVENNLEFMSGEGSLWESGTPTQQNRSAVETNVAPHFLGHPKEANESVPSEQLKAMSAVL
jgi:hypothetical protein